jgi:hypothetical protein
MKVRKEWQDERELFEGVAGALDMGVHVFGDDDEEEAQVHSYDEEGPYGERGQIILLYQGRRFSLELHEIV